MWNACTMWVSLCTCRARAGGQVVVRHLVVTPHLCALHQSIYSPSVRHLQSVCASHGVSICVREHLDWERLHGAAGGLVSEEAGSLCSCAVAPGKSGSAHCQCCWLGWILREKLSTKLLMMFLEMCTVWVFINNLFLHLCNLQYDSVSFLSLICKGIINFFLMKRQFERATH